MSNEEKEKIQKLCDDLVQAFREIAEIVVNVWNKIKETVQVIVKALGKIFLNYYINMIRGLNNKKACKILHIWQHTKNRRIRKKQVKRLNKYLLSYMPF